MIVSDRHELTISDENSFKIDSLIQWQKIMNHENKFPLVKGKKFVCWIFFQENNILSERCRFPMEFLFLNLI